MARSESRSTAKRKVKTGHLPFTKTNYVILAVGLLVIALGYVALSREPWDGTLPLVVSPILLVMGYCVIIPFGILYRSKIEKVANDLAPSSEPRPQQVER